MGSYERRRLSELMNMDRNPELTQYFAIPITKGELRGFQLFKYNKYNAPLGAREIKSKHLCSCFWLSKHSIDAHLA